MDVADCYTVSYEQYRVLQLLQVIHEPVPTGSERREVELEYTIR